MKSKAIIVDIDGTISDTRHRQHFVMGDRKDWKSFFRTLHLDPVMKNCEKILQHFNKAGHRLIFVTGRDEDFRTRTVTWFATHLPWLGAYDLHMRPMGDQRQDAIIKREIYETAIAPQYEVVLCLEDRTRVVEMWRSIGLECWQVASGDF